jgi:hypothetical protein
VGIVRKRSDKQNKRFLRNSRSALSLKTELLETNSSSIRRALNRTSKSALLSHSKSERINFQLARTLTNALLDAPASKLTKHEVGVVKHFNELMHMDLKQAKISKLVPTREDVVILFKILKKANPSVANTLSESFKFRKII